MLQLWRTSLELGILRVLFLLLLITVGLLFIHSKIHHSPYCYILPALILWGVLTIHQKRADLIFLKHIIPYPPLLLFIEYGFLTLPFGIILVCQHQIITLFLFYTILFIISCRKWSIGSGKFEKSGFFQKRIPSELFEWKSGVRRNHLFLLFIYILGIGGIFHIYFSLIAWVLFLSTILSFYDQCEPRNIIELREFPPALFLKKKLIHHLIFMFKCMSPLLLPALIHYEYSLYIAWGILVSAHGLILTLLLKYTSYFPGHRLNITISIAILLALFSILPYLFIFTLAFNLFLYQKAKQNLKTYLA